MSSLEAVDHRLTFDDILEAVQESKRGRWFLKEFEHRLQKQDTSSILHAISKLESRMDGFGTQAAEPDELVKVKAAIANARNDLLKLGVGKDALSPEGQLFANLADMARKAMPAATEGTAGVVRTLQLVAEIENTIVPAPQVDRGAKFFNADENLFERAPAPPKPVLVAPVAAPAPVAVEQPSLPMRKEEPVTTGAKLIIRRTSTPVASEAEQLAAPTVETVAIASPIEDAIHSEPVPVAESEISAINSPRIVIIRRKADEMPEVGAESAA